MFHSCSGLAVSNKNLNVTILGDVFAVPNQKIIMTLLSCLVVTIPKQYVFLRSSSCVLIYPDISLILEECQAMAFIREI